MAYDPTKPISDTNNPENISGNIATTPTGTQVDLTTGQPIFVPTGNITGTDLQPQPKTNFQNVQPTPIPVVPELTLTEPEQKVETGISDLQKLQEQLLGESAFRTGQETTQGLPELQKTQRELSNRLKILSAEREAIPLQLQEEFKGRGVTAGGIAPIEASRLRQNAIQSLAISAQLQATQGNIATANDLIERAVNAKYDPIKEEIQVKKNNLDLILKSPAYSLADKNRANQQKALLNSQNAQIDLAKQNAIDVQKETLKYAGIANAQILNEMGNAANSLEVNKIAAKYGLETLEKQKETANLEQIKSATTKNYAETQKILRESGGVGIGANSGNLLAYAQRLAADGKLPSPAELKLSGLNIGTVSQLAKTLPKPEGTIVDRNTGVRSTNLNATQEDAVSAGYNLVTNTIPELKKAFNDAYTGFIPGIASRIGIRSEAQQHFEDMRTLFLNQLLLANSGKVVSDREMARYQALLPTLGSGAIGITKNVAIFGRNGSTKLDDIENSVTNNLNSFIKTQGLSIYGHSTVNIDGEQHKVGDIIEINGKRGRILPDGSIAEIE